METKQTSRLNVPFMTFLLGTPFIAAALAVSYVAFAGFAFSDLAIFIFMYYATGLAITAGYHRYYAHRTYECNRFVQFLLLVFGAANFQNSLLNWASDHRYHHQYSDKEGDPYTVTKGFWWAHMGWMFFFYPENRPYRNAVDLKNDKLVMWQEKYYYLIATLVSFGLPTLMGAFFGRPWGGFVWGGAVRMVIVHQVTFMVNSVAHSFGKKTYSQTSTARDNTILALLTYGEGFHSFHHAYSSDYRIGIKWYQYDPGKWLIRTLSFLGMAKRLKRPGSLPIPASSVFSAATAQPEARQA